ncbi:hypothetical protein CEP54_010428 [Fusarium duplospermum]|uniref:Short-chain dehydrogenase/reductase family protein n=1 Tax=Fusarium duplospermum TaxID=1325734 RepID=A0A428PK67_9HYPO|nr:hypothetical protein CEP54_010428 [Fusarium duplospermum]
MTASSDHPMLSQSSMGLFFSSQREKAHFPPKDTNLSGQTAIVSGANAGLGFQCARMLLELKLSRVIIASRSLQRGETAAEALRKEYPSASVDVWDLDMASYQSIQAFATRCATLSRIDFVILNAGISKQNFDLAATGHEEAFQVNYLSTVLLAILLLPTLKEKAPDGRPGRLTVVSSGRSMHAKFPESKASPIIPAFDDKNAFDGAERYNTTKFLLHLWIYNLVDYVSPDDVVVNLVDPGFCKGTNLERDFHGAVKAFLLGMKSMVGRPIDAGASTYIDAAVIKGKETHGSFIMDWTICPYGQFFYGPESKRISEKLWEETIAELSFAGVQQVLDKMKAKA